MDTLTKRDIYNTNTLIEHLALADEMCPIVAVLRLSRRSTSEEQAFINAYCAIRLGDILTAGDVDMVRGFIRRANKIQ